MEPTLFSVVLIILLCAALGIIAYAFTGSLGAFYAVFLGSMIAFIVLGGDV